MASREPRNLVAFVIEECVCSNDKSADLQPGKLGKGGFNFAFRTGINNCDSDRHCGGSSPNLVLDDLGNWELRINKQADGTNMGYQFANQLKPLCHKL